jgi:hypothetical protein
MGFMMKDQYAPSQKNKFGDFKVLPKVPNHVHNVLYPLIPHPTNKGKDYNMKVDWCLQFVSNFCIAYVIGKTGFIRWQ